MTFPGANARVFRNEVGEPIGWDYPTDDEPEDTEDFHYLSWHDTPDT